MSAKKFITPESIHSTHWPMGMLLPLGYIAVLEYALSTTISWLSTLFFACLPLSFHPGVTITPGVLRIVWLIPRSSTLPAHSVSILSESPFSRPCFSNWVRYHSYLAALICTRYLQFLQAW